MPLEPTRSLKYLGEVKSALGGGEGGDVWSRLTEGRSMRRLLRRSLAVR